MNDASGTFNPEVDYKTIASTPKVQHLTVPSSKRFYYYQAAFEVVFFSLIASIAEIFAFYLVAVPETKVALENMAVKDVGRMIAADDGNAMLRSIVVHDDAIQNFLGSTSSVSKRNRLDHNHVVAFLGVSLVLTLLLIVSVLYLLAMKHRGTLSKSSIIKGSAMRIGLAVLLIGMVQARFVYFSLHVWDKSGIKDEATVMACDNE